MQNQKKFMEMIQDIVALAKLNERQVTIEFLQDYLKDMKLTKKQMEFVYEYLMQENIKVVGYQKKASKTLEHTLPKTAESLKKEEESEHLGLYFEELRQKGINNKINQEIHRRVVNGDAQAKTLLIEQKLSRVVEIAEQYKNQGLARGDLIQEGNIGLLLAVEVLPEDMAEAERFIDAEIEKSILQALDLYREDKKDNHGLLRKAETLKMEMEKLSEDFGDQMTSDDVARFTGMDLEEIQDILRLIGEENE